MFKNTFLVSLLLFVFVSCEKDPEPISYSNSYGKGTYILSDNGLNFIKKNTSSLKSGIFYNVNGLSIISDKGKNGEITIKEKKVTTNDTITLKSFVTLPEPIVKFSHVNLPATSILEKTNLNIHFLSYWRLLRKNSIVDTQMISNIDTPLEHNEDTFLKGITEYMIDPSIEHDDKYRKY